MKKYQVIIFDLDDTLIDNLENVRNAFKILCEKLKIVYTEELFKKWCFFDKDFWFKYSKNELNIPLSKENVNFVPYVQSMRYHLLFNIPIKEALEVNSLFLNALRENVFLLKMHMKL